MNGSHIEVIHALKGVVTHMYLIRGFIRKLTAIYMVLGSFTTISYLRFSFLISSSHLILIRELLQVFKLIGFKLSFFPPIKAFH